MIKVTCVYGLAIWGGDKMNTVTEAPKEPSGNQNLCHQQEVHISSFNEVNKKLFSDSAGA